MQTSDLFVCNIGMFDEKSEQFFMGELSVLIDSYTKLRVPHQLKFFMLLFIDKAGGEIVIDGQNFLVTAPSIFILKPGCINQLLLNNSTKGRVICFNEDFYSLRYNDNVLKQFSCLKKEFKPGIQISDESQNKWDELLNLFEEEYNRNKMESKKVLRSYLNIILFELERSFNTEFIFKNKTQKSAKIDAFESLIDLHYKSKKLPSAYADLLCISTNHLNKICRYEMGMTAGELIRSKICMEAKKMLIHTNKSINEIATELGFENASYFTSFFRKLTSKSPEVYRRKPD